MENLATRQPLLWKFCVKTTPLKRLLFFYDQKMQFARLGAGAPKLMFFGVTSFFDPIKTTAGTPMALSLPLATTLLTESQSWNLRYHNHNDPIKIIDGAYRQRHPQL